MRRLLFALSLTLLSAPASAETLTGPVVVIDGDTVILADRKIRLVGIDAPELDQQCYRNDEAWACGEEAKRQLFGLVGTSEVTCSGEELDDYGRLIAHCYTGSFNLNRILVAEGWAVAFRRYSEAYVRDELRAKAERRGIWDSTFDLPESYRLARAEPAIEPRQSRTVSRQPVQLGFQGGCTIKGNRNRRGEWIYHLPGMPYYDATRPEEMFCSEAAAQAAGYRRALVR